LRERFHQGSWKARILDVTAFMVDNPTIVIDILTILNVFSEINDLHHLRLLLQIIKHPAMSLHSLMSVKLNALDTSIQTVSTDMARLHDSGTTRLLQSQRRIVIDIERFVFSRIRLLRTSERFNQGALKALILDVTASMVNNHTIVVDVLTILNVFSEISDLHQFRSLVQIIEHPSMSLHSH
jgi:hypothetical protein